MAANACGDKEIAGQRWKQHGRFIICSIATAHATNGLTENGLICTARLNAITDH